MKQELGCKQGFQYTPCNIIFNMSAIHMCIKNDTRKAVGVDFTTYALLFLTIIQYVQWSRIGQF